MSLFVAGCCASSALDNAIRGNAGWTLLYAALCGLNLYLHHFYAGREG
jgi:hypothetical protein